MPLSLSPETHAELCHGHCWNIDDEAALAKLVARVLLGHFRHVQRIIQGQNAALPSMDEAAIADAKERIHLPAGAQPWHRDGLVFQIISWIAACKAANDDAILRAPHLIPAHKGFDGIQINIDSNAGVVSEAIVFEDKATDSPRDTIRDEVWPALTRIQNGERRGELTQEVVVLLTQVCNRIDVDAAIDQIIWRDTHAYRVSLVVGPEFNKITRRRSSGHIIYAVAAQRRSQRPSYPRSCRGPGC